MQKAAQAPQLHVMRLSGTNALVQLLGRASNRSLVETLACAGIDFVVIGGVSLAYHGYRDPFEVDDLDLLFEPSQITIERVVPAVCAHLPWQVSGSAVKPGSKLTLRSPTPFYADLIFAKEIDNAPAIISSAVVVSIGSTTLKVASVEHLKTMKERVVKVFREELRSLTGDRKAFEEKLKRHERDLYALQNA